jgi:hypothetical protein
MQTLAMVVQCAVSCVIGCAAFLLIGPMPESPKAPLIGALIAGFGGGWLVMFLYVWARHGWRAARSMSLTP